MNTSSHPESLRILLAEDSYVNQQRALALLSAEGHDVAVATTGRVAADICMRDAFDLILMDVQMPEMDGMEATALIRSRERTSGKHIPIIAMAAGAVEDDRQRCLAAGMDGYLSKPIRAEDLFAVIKLTLDGLRGLPPAAIRPSDAALAASADTADVVEIVRALRENPGLAGPVARVAADEVPRLMGEIRRAVEHGDVARLRLAAHTLKGSLGYFGNTSALNEARHMEEMGKMSSLMAAREALESLEDASRRIVRLLEEHACGRTPVSQA